MDMDVIYPADVRLVLPLEEELKKSLTGMGKGITELVDSPLIQDYVVTHYLVVTYNNQPIGSATIRMGSPRCELYKLFVSRQFRKRGVGQFLFEQVLSRMRVIGIEEVKVEAQTSSAHFWKKMCEQYKYDEEISCFSQIIFVL